MTTQGTPFESAAGHRDGGDARPTAIGLVLTSLWFGLLTGWLELGLVLARGAVNPHVPIERLGTNRHFVWMVPVSDVLLFGAVGLALMLAAVVRRELAGWIAWRLWVGLSLLTLLLTIEGIYAIAAVIMACGLALNIGPRLYRNAAGVGRLVRWSFPVLGLGLVLLTILSHERVASSERRALSRLPAAKPGVPNVLLLVLDDVRAASLSLHGYTRSTTPNLERLARRGVVFSEARSTAPWTLPSHASMMTGRWPHELSVGPDLPLDGTFPTLAETLASAGYATAGFVGNTLYCNALYGMARGFARYEDAYESQTVSLFETVRSSGLGKRVLQLLGYSSAFELGTTSVRKTAAMLNRDVFGWLAEQPTGRPFFVFVNYYDAHTPYIFHDGPDPRFGLAALPLAEHAVIDKRFWDLAAGKPAPDGIDSQQIADQGFALLQDSYDSCIAYLDRQVGLLLDELERRGVLENTLVIVTSDHGEQFGERGLLGHGVSLYRREVHVPLVVVPPGRSPRARVVAQPVSNREIAATVAARVELNPRNPFPGRSLTRFLDHDAEQLPDPSPVLCEVQHIEATPRRREIPATLGSIASLVTRDSVYIRSAGGREELYDLVRDARESVDLSGYPQSRGDLDRFREELRRLYPGATGSER